VEPSHVHSIRGQRELRRLQRPSKNGRLLVLIGIGLLLVIIAVETGRVLQQMRRVDAFLKTFESKPPATVKAELARLAPGLVDRNPLARNITVAAFKLATGWIVEGDGPGDWHNAWEARKARWEYLPGGQTNQPPAAETVAPHRYRQAFPPEAK